MKRKQPMVCKLDTYKMAKATDVPVVHKYLNSIQALGGGGGRGGIVPTGFPCCAKTVCSRLMKLSDF